MKSFLVIGLGRFGRSTAEKLIELRHEVLAVDMDEDRVNEIMPFVTDAMIGDATKESFISTLGVDNFDVCIVTIGSDFQSSLETTSLLKELGGKLIVSRAGTEIQAKFLLRNGADEVLDPEKQIAEWAAIRYASNHILNYISLDEDHAIYEVSVPNEWIGRSIGRIDIRKRYGINILAVKQGKKMNLSVTPETVLYEGMSMLVLGERKAMKRCFKI